MVFGRMCPTAQVHEVQRLDQGKGKEEGKGGGGGEGRDVFCVPWMTCAQSVQCSAG